MNILDLPDDILKIIEIKLQEIKEKDEDYAYMDEGIEYLKRNKIYNSIEVGEMLYDRLYKIGYSWNDIYQYKKSRNILF